MLKNISHYYLKHMKDVFNIFIYILFSYLKFAYDNFIGLTNEQHSRWLNQIFYSAIYNHFKAHYTQHCPASHRHFLTNNKAR
jgi:hypothetical protein